MVKASSCNSGTWERFNQALVKTRSRIAVGIGDLFLGEKTLDESIFDDLELLLLTADVGPQATEEILERLRKKIPRRELKDSTSVRNHLKTELNSVAKLLETPFTISADRPCVVLVVGVNGTGKTTTIGKLSYRLKQQGHSVMLAAGDTYRAAAIEQLTKWGESNDVPVVAQRMGSDAAAVIHDAMQTAISRGIDVVIADTAGRLQSKTGLMDELSKVRRVINRLDPNAPHECILVLDGTVGQNALVQVKEFHEAVNLSGLVLTKLDGSAKGGVILALPSVANLPLYFVGLGESIDALHAFDAEAYVDGLLDS